MHLNTALILLADLNLYFGVAIAKINKTDDTLRTSARYKLKTHLHSERDKQLRVN